MNETLERNRNFFKRLKASDYIATLAILVSISIPLVQYLTATHKIAGRMGDEIEIWYESADYLKNYVLTVPITIWNDGRKQGVIEKVWIDLVAPEGKIVKFEALGYLERKEKPTKSGVLQYGWRKSSSLPVLYYPEGKGASMQVGFSSPKAVNKKSQLVLVPDKTYKMRLKAIDSTRDEILDLHTQRIEFKNKHIETLKLGGRKNVLRLF
ncbi:MAG: hypothetical protein GY705_17745 [Bacteroidetes bacterium]|nr:hypothetical protein [Bacteroidota bacterium]